MNAQDALRHLQAHPDTWIPVTSEQTIDALRELRKNGHRVVTRFEDDGSRMAKYVPPTAAATLTHLAEEAKRIFDGEITRIVDADGVILLEETSFVPLTPESIAAGTQPILAINGVPTAAALTPGMAGRSFPMGVVQDDTGGFRVELAPRTRCECGDDYLILEDHVRGQRHQNWLGGETQLEVPVPAQPPVYKFRLGEVPEHFELGTIVVCPVCKNKRVGPRKTKDGSIRPGNDFSNATGRPGRPCDNCNGNGMVPNIGPVQTATQGGQREPDRPTEPAPGQLTVHDGPETLDPERAGELSRGAASAGGSDAGGSDQPVDEAGGQRHHLHAHGWVQPKKRRKPSKPALRVVEGDASGS